MRAYGLVLLCFCLSSFQLEAGYRKYGGNWIQEKYVPYMSLDKHLELAKQCQEQQDWLRALNHYEIVLHHSAQRAAHLEALYGTAFCRYNLGDYENANISANTYLKEADRNQLLMPLMEMKFQIAEKFKAGAKRRPFSWSVMPKILSAKELAAQIYDEVAVAAARTDLAAQALLSKAFLLRRQKQFSHSNQALQQIINDFDKQPYVLQAFGEIARNYLLEMRTSSKSEEFLELARINRQKMLMRFPNADTVDFDRSFQAMRELYAMSLIEAAELYRKKGQASACKLYIGRVTSLYSDTRAALQAQQTLQKLSS